MGERLNKETCSIKDVAIAAGVSVATVSRVLNDKGYVSQDAEKKVRDAVEKCRYVPNMAARGLRTNRMPLVGFILPNIQNEYFASVASEVQDRLLKYGYFVIFCTTKHHKDIERTSVQMLISQNVTGLIMIADDATCRMVPHSLPCVGIDCFPREDALDSFAVVHSDDDMGGYLATRELIEKGCRRIAIFAGFSRGYTHQQRLTGYKRALAESALAFDPRLVFYSDELTFEEGTRLVGRLLASGVEFDGIFGISDYIIQGSMDELIRRKVAIPDDVRIVGFDDSPMAERGNRKLTTIHRPTDQIAELTTKLLIDMIAGRKAGQPVYTLPVWLVRRETT